MEKYSSRKTNILTQKKNAVRKKYSENKTVLRNEKSMTA